MILCLPHTDVNRIGSKWLSNHPTAAVQQLRSLRPPVLVAPQRRAVCDMTAARLRRIPLLSAVGPAGSNRDTSDVIPAARSKGPVIWDANRYHHGTTTRQLARTSLYRMNLEVGLSVRRAFARVETDNLVEGGGFHVHQCELLPAHDATAPSLVHSGGRGQLWNAQTTIAIHGRAPRP